MNLCNSISIRCLVELESIPLRSQSSAASPVDLISLSGGNYPMLTVVAKSESPVENGTVNIP